MTITLSIWFIPPTLAIIGVICGIYALWADDSHDSGLKNFLAGISFFILLIGSFISLAVISCHARGIRDAEQRVTNLAIIKKYFDNDWACFYREMQSPYVLKIEHVKEFTLTHKNMPKLPQEAINILASWCGEPEDQIVCENMLDDFLEKPAKKEDPTEHANKTE